MKKLWQFLKSLFHRVPANPPPEPEPPPLPPAVPNKPITPYEVAKSQEGVSERYNPSTIKKYHEAAGIKADERTPWCASFMSWCFANSSYASHGIKSAWARDWLKVGKDCTHDIQEGDILVFSRGDAGHVGFYVGQEKDCYQVLGGNESNEVRIKLYPKANLLGARDYVSE